ncbi:MAG: acyl-CoA dehydrogenase [Gammaproteobacteria bacterium]|nr:acyl-CoA dehydrogenase [Gammaproteobacteria bacterium]NIR84301.1 acyl-CoA dehydrogenase [Gammaproteobacteria bacterium]NIR89771.1 acyl-CoA dehydrogenase [Gammaproteobacteria bacterium]NIU05459.1 acyl-CoA dehydrogenase [Gammaproteobacteria bacterium]NIV52406.1 acyl-CoA dehydrogenase [Gammaproteobacteria bacterium]
MADFEFLKWPFFDDAHRALAERLDEWANHDIAPLTERESDVDDTCRELVARLGRGGWLRHVVPAADGGASERLDVRSLCLARETLARHGGLADFAFAMQGLGSAPISLFGDEAQRRKYLPRVRDGEKIAAFALSEPEAGSDVAAIDTSARRDGDEYVLDGTKTWISNGGIADFYVVFARTGEAPGARGLSAFVVDADTAGLEVSERIRVIAPHPLATLRLRDCRVPQSQLLAQPGSGFKVAMATLDIFRTTVGAAALGFAHRALDAAAHRAVTRELFGAPLGELQMVQSMLAEMATAVDAAALLVYRAAWTRDCAAERVTREAAMAKLYATEAAQEVIDRAVQIFGGLGVVSGHPVERLYREIRALRIYEGASEIQKVIIARQTLAAYEAAAMSGND